MLLYSALREDFRAYLAYVDDVAIGVAGMKMESPEMIKNEMQKLSNKYDKYLFAAGGRLNISKCLWYLIDFTRSRNKITYNQNFENEQFDLNVMEAFSKKNKTIKRLNPNQSHKSLGVHLAPDGNQETEIKYSKRKLTHGQC